MTYQFASESVSFGHPDKLVFLHLAHNFTKFQTLEKELADYICPNHEVPYNPENCRN
jgi:hypothetical protein